MFSLEYLKALRINLRCVKLEALPSWGAVDFSDEMTSSFLELAGTMSILS